MQFEALRHKPESRTFDSHLYHWNFRWHNPSRRTMTMGSSRPLTEMNIRNIFWGWRWPVLRADNLTSFMCRLSWNLGASTFWNFTFAAYNQQDAKFLNIFISVRRSTCFRRSFCPSSGAQNRTYSVRYLSDRCLTLYVQFRAPDDGRKPCLKHVERLTEINILRNFASCWLYVANILTMHGHMNVKLLEISGPLLTGVGVVYLFLTKVIHKIDFIIRN